MLPSISHGSGSCNYSWRHPETLQPETYSLGIHVDSMQNATQRTIILVGLAVALTMVSPSIAATTAAPEIPTETTVGDTLVHTVRAGDTLNALAVHYRAEAGWYGQADCLRAIRQANGLEETNLLMHKLLESREIAHHWSLVKGGYRRSDGSPCSCWRFRS